MQLCNVFSVLDDDRYLHDDIRPNNYEKQAMLI